MAFSDLCIGFCPLKTQTRELRSRTTVSHVTNNCHVIWHCEPITLGVVRTPLVCPALFSHVFFSYGSLIASSVGSNEYHAGYDGAASIMDQSVVVESRSPFVEFIGGYVLIHTLSCPARSWNKRLADFSTRRRSPSTWPIIQSPIQKRAKMDIQSTVEKVIGDLCSSGGMTVGR